jgi:adenylate cyclase
MAHLRIFTPYGKIINREIGKDLLPIGRAEENEIVLADHTASRRHARIRRTQDGFFLEDLGSHNGTFVNDERVTRRLLKHNDLVKIGTSTITFLDAPVRPSDAAFTRPQTIRHDRSQLLAEPVELHDEATDQEVVASIKATGYSQEVEVDLLPKIDSRQLKAEKTDVLDLEKTNKTLFVLYQISRTLNRNEEFDELLKTIMDLIFQVVEADYGFVALLGSKPGELIPKVIKYRTSPRDSEPELKLSRAIVDKVINEKEAILTSNAMDDDRFGGSKSIFLQNIRSVISVPLFRRDRVIGLIQVDSFRLSNTFTRADLDLMTTISHQMAIGIEQANLNEKIRNQEKARSRLERFHSPEVVDFIVNGEEVDEETLMAPKEKFVTMLFTDIVNFTPMSERFPPSEISRLLNTYYAAMTDIIFDYNGTLDKYMGDAIMAIFGAPIERDNDPERAIWAAMEMRRRLFEIREDFKPDQRFDIRLGINSGRVVAGNLGSHRRLDYSVIGDTVNVASRLEAMADPNQILIGETTRELVAGKFNIREIGLRELKGKTEPVRVFEVLD